MIKSIKSQPILSVWKSFYGIKPPSLGAPSLSLSHTQALILVRSAVFICKGTREDCVQHWQIKWYTWSQCTNLQSIAVFKMSRPDRDFLPTFMKATSHSYTPEPVSFNAVMLLLWSWLQTLEKHHGYFTNTIPKIMSRFAKAIFRLLLCGLPSCSCVLSVRPHALVQWRRLGWRPSIQMTTKTICPSAHH